MVVWLPYPNAAVSAHVLHHEELYFTRYGCSDMASRFPEHRTFFMMYLSVVSRELLYRNRLGPLFQAYFWDGTQNPYWFYGANYPAVLTDETLSVPPWVGDPEFHAAERLRLEAERPSYYNFGQGETT